MDIAAAQAAAVTMRMRMKTGSNKGSIPEFDVSRKKR
jgi:hypothetical protein